MADLIGQLLRETLDVDGRVFRTIRALLLSPGFLTCEYLSGRRKSYTSPIRLYLAISVSFFVLAAWLAGRGVLLDAGMYAEQDAASQAQFMSNTLPRLMFFLLPIFAVLLKLAFPDRFLFVHLVCSMHLHSVSYVVLAFMLPLERLANEHWIPLLTQFVLLGYFLMYLVVSLRRVYQATWAITAWKSLAIMIAYLAILSFVIETLSNLRILSD